MIKAIKEIINRVGIPFYTFFGGIALQIIIWIASFPSAGVKSIFFNTILPTICFFIPLLSLVGIYSGIRFARKHNKYLLSSIGIGLNVLWLLVFLFACYLVFILRVSAWYLESPRSHLIINYLFFNVRKYHSLTNRWS